MTDTKEEIEALLEKILLQVKATPGCVGMAGVIVIAMEEAEDNRNTLFFHVGERSINWREIINLASGGGYFDEVENEETPQ